MDVLTEAAKAVIAAVTGIALKALWDRYAGKEARLARRRSRGPCYALFHEFVPRVHGRGEHGPVMWGVQEGNVLDVYHQEVSRDVRPFPIILLIENHGEPARSMSVEMECCSAEIATEPQIHDAHGLEYLAYEQIPDAADKPVKFRVRFTSLDGHDDVHTYETVHGRRALRRIDPA